MALTSTPFSNDAPEQVQSVDVEASAGSFDVVLCGEPGYQCVYRNLAADGRSSPEHTFSLADYIPDGEVGRLTANSGAVIYSGGVAGQSEHDLFFQPIGCR